jgi:hypothetical protein
VRFSFSLGHAVRAFAMSGIARERVATFMAAEEGFRDRARCLPGGQNLARCKAKELYSVEDYKRARSETGPPKVRLRIGIRVQGRAQFWLGPSSNP